MRATVTQLAQKTSTKQACDRLAYPRSSYYRQQQAKPAVPEPRPVKPSPRALPAAEREAVRALLNSDRFVDKSPRQMYGTLLDEKQYLCSVSTMYRILKEHAEVRERRNQKRHPAYKKPELLATGPNQVWSWDITKLRGPAPHVYYYMYSATRSCMDGCYD
jgi:putative transposase